MFFDGSKDAALSDFGEKDLRPVHTVLTIQVLSSFGAGVLGVILPLILKQREISIVVVGFIFAAMPLIMQLVRMAFATLSDFWGRRFFFVLSGLFGAASSLIFCIAHTPLEYLFGKVAEGSRDGTLWAVNRAFLLEESHGQWKILVRLRTVSYLATAAGSLLAGFIVSLLFFEVTMLLCAMLGGFVALISLTLARPKRGNLQATKALRFLDLRNKDKIFRTFFVLFCVMGACYGLIGSFVITWFLSVKGFDAEVIGLTVGLQVLLAGFSTHFFSRFVRPAQSIVASGLFFFVIFALLGFSTPVLAAVLIVVFGGAQGMISIAQEGIHSRICRRESYATDIGLLWTGYHIAESLSMALTGYLISLYGFVASFIIAALMYVLFSFGAYRSLNQ